MLRSPSPPARGTRKESSIAPGTQETDSGHATEYTYLEVPQAAEARSCLGIVLAGLAARAEVGVGGLDEAVRTLEDAHAVGGHTSYRFALEEGKILAQVEEMEPESPESEGEDSGWRTLVELIS